MKRSTLLKLTALTIVLSTIMSVVMLQFDWNGEQASSEAAPIDTLFDVTIVISSFVFVLVMVGLGYAIWRWRAAPGDESDGLPIHGNTRLEVFWTLIPTLIVIGLAVYSFIVLTDIEKPAAKDHQLPVHVIAQQYKWTFEYTDHDVVSNELHVPIDTQLDLKLTAIDVIHSFWVPEWRIKRDLVPKSDHDTAVDDTVFVTPNKLGTYQLICTELCGWGHATMRAIVVVETREDFNQWIEDRKAIGDMPDVPVAEGVGGGQNEKQ